MSLFDLPRGHFGAILADPPTQFETWSDRGKGRSAEKHYDTMDWRDLARMPVAQVAARDCALFLWACWPTIQLSLDLIHDWGFTYKSCAFDWMKITAAGTPTIGLGYWTRANTEPCLFATRGKPKRLNADVAQAVLSVRRQHSHKPEVVHQRIERLVAGPYLELFARQERRGWTCWGNEVDKFPPARQAV